MTLVCSSFDLFPCAVAVTVNDIGKFEYAEFSKFAHSFHFMEECLQGIQVVCTFDLLPCAVAVTVNDIGKFEYAARCENFECLRRNQLRLTHHVFSCQEKFLRAK